MDSWALPNLHGDITATTDPAGAITGAGYLYDPYGQPLDPTTGAVNTTATPTTRSGTTTTDAWVGSHQRSYEHPHHRRERPQRMARPHRGTRTRPTPRR